MATPRRARVGEVELTLMVVGMYGPQMTNLVDSHIL
jgi:hypothetical protein